MIKKRDVASICKKFNLRATYSHILGKWIFENPSGTFKLDIPLKFISKENKNRAIKEIKTYEKIKLSSIISFFGGFVSKRYYNNDYIITSNLPIKRTENNTYIIDNDYIIFKGNIVEDNNSKLLVMNA